MWKYDFWLTVDLENLEVSFEVEMLRFSEEWSCMLKSFVDVDTFF